MGLTKLVPWVLAARRDIGRTLVLLAIEALTPERLDWGQAMLGELDHIIARAFAGGLPSGAYARP